MSFRLAAALAAAAVSLAAVAPAASAQEAVQDRHLDAARRLAELINPYDLMVEKNMTGWEAAARQALALDPAMKTLEAQHPGATGAALAATRPLAQADAEGFVRKVTELTAKVLAERMTGPELAELTGFHSSTTGRKLNRQLFENADPGRLAAGAVAEYQATGDVRITDANVREVERNAAMKTAAQLSADDQVAIIRFAQRPVAKKYGEVRVEIDRSVMRLVNEKDEPRLAQHREAFQAGLLAFIDGKK